MYAHIHNETKNSISMTTTLYCTVYAQQKIKCSHATEIVFLIKQLYIYNTLNTILSAIHKSGWSLNTKTHLQFLTHARDYRLQSVSWNHGLAGYRYHCLAGYRFPYRYPRSQ